MSTQAARTKELLARSNPKATRQDMKKHANKRTVSYTGATTTRSTPTTAWGLQGGTRYTPGRPGIAPHTPRRPERESSSAQVARIKREKAEKVKRMSNAIFGSRPARIRTTTNGSGRQSSNGKAAKGGSGAVQRDRAETSLSRDRDRKGLQGKEGKGKVGAALSNNASNNGAAGTAGGSAAATAPKSQPGSGRQAGAALGFHDSSDSDSDADSRAPVARRGSWMDVHALMARRRENITLSVHDADSIEVVEAITKAEIARFKRLAMEAEKRMSGKRAAHIWLQSTKLGPSSIGPLAVPTSLQQAIQLHAGARQHPTTAACFFILCALARKNSKLKGNRIVSLAMHPSCLIVDPDSTTKASDQHHAGTLPIRRHSVKHLKLFPTGSHSLSSYVGGATPDNGYTFDPTHCKFAVDREHTRIAPGHTEKADLWEIYLFSSGMSALHRKSRCIKVQLHEGGWYVRNFTELAAPVTEPAEPLEMAGEVTRAMAGHLSHGAYAEQPKYHAGGGFQPAMNLDAKMARNKWKTKAALAKPETVLARLKRLSAASTNLTPHTHFLLLLFC